MIVLFCAVTAFADSFNALEQKIMIKGSRYEGLKEADSIQAQIIELSTGIESSLE